MKDLIAGSLLAEPTVPLAGGGLETYGPAMPPRPQTLGGLLSRYLPPPIVKTAGDLQQGLLTFAQIFGPAADIKGMVDSSADTMNALRQGDYGGAIANFGLTAAAPIGLFIPGSIRTYGKAGETMADALQQQTMYNRGSKSGGPNDIPVSPGKGAPVDGGGPVRAPEQAPIGGRPAVPEPFATPEGVRLSGSKTIVGVGYPGGPDVPLSLQDSLRAASALTDYSEVAKNKLPCGSVGAWSPPYYPRDHDAIYGSLIPGSLKVYKGLGDQSMIKTRIHETIYEIDKNLGAGATRAQSEIYMASLPKEQQEQLQRELNLIAREVRPWEWTNGTLPRPVPGLSKQAVAYATSIQENLSRVGELYATDPARTKAKFPEAAKFFRSVWNGTERALNEIGFNQIVAPVGSGLLGIQMLDAGDE